MHLVRNNPAHHRFGILVLKLILVLQSREGILLLLLPDKRRKKYTKARNHNKTYPNKPSLE